MRLRSAARLACSALLPLSLAAPGALAQDDDIFERTVIQTENVRYAYAQVLRVTPVYQTLTATAIERHCEGEPQADEDSGLSRMVGKVREAFTPDQDGTDPAPEDGCVMVPVERKYRRPIAFDVDYVYKGAKYRSRLPEDPGNRLRIRIGVTPVMGGPR
jgi:uncharacterized protein YcfJ